MSDAHDALRSLIDSKDLRLLWVFGLPRSNSTALHIALAQAPEVQAQLNEPFFHPDHRVTRWDSQGGEPTRSFEDGCRHVLDLYEEVRPRARGMITLMIHDHAKDVVEAEFEDIAALAGHMVFVLREPISQAVSLLTRLCNEILSQKGRSAVSTTEAISLLRDDPSYARFVADHPGTLKSEGPGRHAVLGAWRGSSEVAWTNTLEYSKRLRARAPEKASMFDAAWLFSAPERELARTAERAGITYVPQMIQGWTKGVGEDFRCIITKEQGKDAVNNPWNGPARTSTGIAVKPESASAAKVKLEDMPQEIRGQLAGYDEIFRSLFA